MLTSSRAHPNPGLRSWVYRTRFGLSRLALWGSIFSFNVQDSLYNFGFNADSGTTATISLVVGIVGVLFLLTIGQLQDYEILNRFFPVKEWGRRAPWYKIHLFGAFVVILLLMNPGLGMDIQHCECENINDLCNNPVTSVNGVELCQVECNDVIEVNHTTLAETVPKCSIDKGTCSTKSHESPKRPNATLLELGCPEGYMCMQCNDRWQCNSTKCEIKISADEETVSLSDTCPDGKPKRRHLDRTFLAIWSSVLLVVGAWCGNAMRVSCSAAFYEVFPVKEHRIAVVGHNMFWFTASLIVIIILMIPFQFGGFPDSVNWKTWSYGFGFILLTSPSFLCITPMKDAHQSQAKLTLSPLNSILGLIKNSAFRMMVLIDALNGVVNGNQSVFAPFYFFFVAKISRNAGTFYLTLYIPLGIVTELLCAPLWTRLFQRYNPKRFAQFGMVLHLISALILYNSGVDKLTAFFIEFVFARVLLSPRTYWKIIYVGYLIDDDCAKLDGSRREGMILSMLLMFEQIIVGIMPQIFIILMVSTGLNSAVQDLEETPCYHEDVMEQDDPEGTFIVMIYMLVNPICNILQAIAIQFFPLDGGSHTITPQKPNVFLASSLSAEEMKISSHVAKQNATIAPIAENEVEE